MIETQRWTNTQSAALLRHPRPTDDKYTRGVLGISCGSEEYPGAAVLSVSAALHSGVGMVRYLGSETPRALVLARRPEVVPGDGRLTTLLIGSGLPPVGAGSAPARRVDRAIAEHTSIVLDAGALGLVTRCAGTPTVITPHAGELARLTGGDTAAISADPVAAARDAAARFDVVVVLKGALTIVATPSGDTYAPIEGSPWLSTAGTGDVLAGILGALVAGDAAIADPTPDRLAQLAATAVSLHSLASMRRDGPVLALELAEAVRDVVTDLLGQPDAS